MSPGIDRMRLPKTFHLRQRPATPPVQIVRIEGVRGSNPLSSTRKAGQSPDRQSAIRALDHLTVTRPSRWTSPVDIQPQTLTRDGTQLQ